MRSDGIAPFLLGFNLSKDIIIRNNESVFCLINLSAGLNLSKIKKKVGDVHSPKEQKM